MTYTLGGLHKIPVIANHPTLYALALSGLFFYGAFLCFRAMWRQGRQSDG